MWAYHHLTVKIGVDGETEEHVLAFEFEVKPISVWGVTAPIPIVTGTKEIFPSGEHGSANWFWEFCPPRLTRILDREMIETWNEAHGLTIRRTA